MEKLAIDPSSSKDWITELIMQKAFAEISGDKPKSNLNILDFDNVREYLMDFGIQFLPTAEPKLVEQDPKQ